MTEVFDEYGNYKYPTDQHHSHTTASGTWGANPFPLVESKPSPWHTGTPTEKGLYLVFTNHLTYDIKEVHETWSESFIGVKAWQKIEPYKE